MLVSNVDVFAAEVGNAGELLVMPRYGLDQGAKIGSRYPKDECPVLLWVQIRVRKNEETLVCFGLQSTSHDHIEEILSVELLAFGVHTDSCLNQAIFFQVLEVKLFGWILEPLTLDTWEKYLRMLDQLIYKFLIEWVLAKG